MKDYFDGDYPLKAHRQAIRLEAHKAGERAYESRLWGRRILIWLIVSAIVVEVGLLAYSFPLSFRLGGDGVWFATAAALGVVVWLLNQRIAHHRRVAERTAQAYLLASTPEPNLDIDASCVALLFEAIRRARDMALFALKLELAQVKNAVVAVTPEIVPDKVTRLSRHGDILSLNFSGGFILTTENNIVLSAFTCALDQEHLIRHTWEQLPLGALRLDLQQKQMDLPTNQSGWAAWVSAVRWPNLEKSGLTKENLEAMEAAHRSGIAQHWSVKGDKVAFEFLGFPATSVKPDGPFLSPMAANAAAARWLSVSAEVLKTSSSAATHFTRQQIASRRNTLRPWQWIALLILALIIASTIMR